MTKVTITFLPFDEDYAIESESAEVVVDSSIGLDRMQIPWGSCCSPSAAHEALPDPFSAASRLARLHPVHFRIGGGVVPNRYRLRSRRRSRNLAKKSAALSIVRST